MQADSYLHSICFAQGRAIRFTVSQQQFVAWIYHSDQNKVEKNGFISVSPYSDSYFGVLERTKAVRYFTVYGSHMKQNNKEKV